MQNTHHDDRNAMFLDRRRDCVSAPIDVSLQQITESSFVECVNGFRRGVLRIVDFHRNFAEFIEINTCVHFVIEQFGVGLLFRNIKLLESFFKNC